MSNGEGTVPTFVNALLKVISDVSIKVVDTFFPGLVLLKSGLAVCFVTVPRERSAFFLCAMFLLSSIRKRLWLAVSLTSICII